MKITAKHMKWFHLGMAVLWILLTIPTLLFWSQSVLWVSLMSLYAIIIAHIGAYQGARAERAQEKK